jgi:hypothetical protein
MTRQFRLKLLLGSTQVGLAGGETLGVQYTWGCYKDEVERGFLRRVTGVGSESDPFRVHPILLRPP